MHSIIQADAGRLPLATQSVDLVIGSPPYIDARTYLEDGIDLGIARKCDEWIDWMLGVTAECLRVSRGLVLWVVAGKTEDWCYQPGPEGLLYRWWQRSREGVPSGFYQDGIELREASPECHLFRPCYWHRVGIPGSGGKQWYRADVEYVLAFKRPGKLAYGNPIANGHPPKWAPGGEMSYRLKNGQRVDQWGSYSQNSGTNRNADGTRHSAGRPSHRFHTKREADDCLREQRSNVPTLANPGNFLKTTVGGGQLGHKLAHENEAPYPVAVPAFFINSHCPPAGTVLDPFTGSGSTGQATRELGRNYIGCDLRMSQCRLSRRRLATVTPGFAFADAD